MKSTKYACPLCRKNVRNSLKTLDPDKCDYCERRLIQEQIAKRLNSPEYLQAWNRYRKDLKKAQKRYREEYAAAQSLGVFMEPWPSRVNSENVNDRAIFENIKPSHYGL